MYIDFFDDSSTAVLSEIIRDIGPDNVPDYVKTAALIPSTEFRADKHLFADIETQKFACDTPQDTWLSVVYYIKQAADISPNARPRIEQALLDACDIHGMPTDGLFTKAATQFETPIYLIDSVAAPADCVDLSLLPVHSKEAVDLSARSFRPENLPEGEELHAAKYANTLVSLCEDYDLPVPGSLAHFSQPVKRSHVIETIRQRTGFVLMANEAFDKQAGLQKAAADRGVELPYSPINYDRFDSRLLQAYDALSKVAYTGDLDEEFWATYYTLDKLAGLHQHPGMFPVITMANRPVIDDIYENSIKLAGVQILIQELQKVAVETLADLAPDAAAYRDQPAKFATMLHELSPDSQRALVMHLRGL